MNMRRALILLLPAIMLGPAAGLAAQDRTDSGWLFDRPMITMFQTAGQAWLGIRYAVQPSAAADRPEVLVLQVEAESPAADAGLQPGDVLLRLNDLPLTRGLLTSVIRTIQPGDDIRVLVRRGADEFDVNVRAAERPDRFRDAAWSWSGSFDSDSFRNRLHELLDAARFHIDTLSFRIPDFRIEFNDSTRDAWTQDFRRHLRPDSVDFDADGRGIWIMRTPSDHDVQFWLDNLTYPRETRMSFGFRAVAGAEFTELDGSLAGYFPGAEDGLLVLSVAAETPAARAGLEAGDVVTRAEGMVVRAIPDLRHAIERADNEAVRLEVLRRGQMIEVQLSRGPLDRPTRNR